MKQLIFLRHAKSSWEYNVEDYDRPLSSKGMSDIDRVSKNHSGFFKNFQIILTSPANRAFHTSIILTRNVFNDYKRLSVAGELYSFNYEKVIDYVHNLDDKYTKIILVGHNPAFSIAARHLSQTSPPDLRTSDWITLEFQQNEWAKINKGNYTYESKKS